MVRRPVGPRPRVSLPSQRPGVGTGARIVQQVRILMATTESSPATPQSVPGWSMYRRLWIFIRPYGRPLAFVIAMSLCATALTLFQPYFSKLLIDRALMQRDMHALI